LRAAGQRLVDAGRELYSDRAGFFNRAAIRLGHIFERQGVCAIPGAVKNTRVVLSATVTRANIFGVVKSRVVNTIPDLIETAGGFLQGHIIEFKNGLVVSYLTQLEVQYVNAVANGIPWYVVVRNGILVTNTVQRLAGLAGGGIWIFDPAMGTFRPYP